MAITLGGGPSLSSTFTSASGAFGTSALGTTSLGGSINLTHDLVVPPTETDTSVNYISPLGVGFLGARIYSKPVVVIITIISPIGDAAFEVTFYTRSGSKLGVIGTSALKNFIKEIMWIEDRRGVGNASIKLTKLPEFPVVPFSQVGIKFGDSAVENYRGTVRVDNQDGTTRDEYEFRAMGRREQLNALSTNNTIISGPQDVAVTARELYDDFVQTNTDIPLAIDEFDSPAGVLHSADLEFGKHEIEKLFESLAIMASSGGQAYNSGVNGRGRFFFEKEPTAPREVFFVGYGRLIEFKPEFSSQNVRNSIIVKRNQESGSGKAGWTVTAASPYNDATSQAKFGFRELTFQVPGYFDESDGDLVGNQVLADRKDPETSAKATILIEEASQLLKRGNYEFVAQLGEYEVEITENDEIGNWFKVGAGDLALSIDTTVLVSGAGSLKLEWTSANTDRAEFTLDEPILGSIKEIRFFTRAAKLGTYLTFGAGESAYTENTTSVTIGSSNVFQTFRWDVSDLGIDKLGQIAFRIDTTDSGAVFIDRVVVVKNDFRHFVLRFNRVKYRFKPDTGLLAEAEFGPLPPEQEDFIKELVKLATDNEKSLEEQ